MMIAAKRRAVSKSRRLPARGAVTSPDDASRQGRVEGQGGHGGLSLGRLTPHFTSPGGIPASPPTAARASALVGNPTAPPTRHPGNPNARPCVPPGGFNPPITCRKTARIEGLARPAMDKAHATTPPPTPIRGTCDALFKFATACLIAAGLAGPWSPGIPTLQKIQGQRQHRPRPPGVVDPSYHDKRQAVGYSRAAMLKVVDAVRPELPNLTAGRPVTSQETASRWCRTALSISSSAFHHPQQRAGRQTAFSRHHHLHHRYAPDDPGSDLGISDFADLAGKHLVTTADTTSGAPRRKMNDDKRWARRSSAPGHGETF